MKPYLKVYIAQFLLAALLLNMAPLQPIALAETDTTPPVIDAHADEVVEATSSSGVVVSYVAPNAVDDVDGVFAATCLPASETQFSIGDTIVTCNASDAAGNAAASTSFTVTVIDTTSPVITIIGDSNIEVIVGTPYSDAGATALDTVDGDITTSIVTVNTVDTSVIGNYTVSYNVSDAAGNAAIEVVRSVEVVVAPDTTPPVIDAHADEVVEATSSSGVVVSYVAPNAVDDVDGVFASTCLPASETQFSIGDTIVTCNASDAGGNAAVSTSFTVTVRDTTSPVITIIGDLNIEVIVGTPYSDAGAAALDTVDGDITSSIVTVNTVDTSVIGNYTVSYNVSDAAGNAAIEVVRSVEVVVAPDTTPPVIDAHADEVVEATSSSGVVVSYVAPNAVDDVDGVFAATCLPASGNVFPLGDTTVICTAADTAGNVAVPTIFTISVSDTAPPTLVEVTPVTTPTNDISPSFTFSSSEA